jgi:ribosomal protein S18 acetylase RimI-like enzyme
MPDAIAIRRATKVDLPALGRLGALLLRTHYQFDPLRFMAPGSHPEEGYAWFLGTQLREEDVVVFVAERESSIVGYVYAALEPESWKELREACGFIHDVVVDESGRRSGVATLLMEAAIGWLRERGAPRVVLGTAQRNDAAQRLFERLGFRRTMIEMTREI